MANAVLAEVKLPMSRRRSHSLDLVLITAVRAIYESAATASVGNKAARPGALCLLAATVVLLAAFLVAETRSTTPLLPAGRGLFRSGSAPLATPRGR